MVSFFHSYDLRGTYPDEISETEAEKVGKAYGTFIDADEVLVARDGRTHGEKITEAFIRGIRSTGTDVADSGVIPSPVAYFTAYKRDFKSAAVVTASHNPSEYTGFKFTLEDALAMSRDGGMKAIEEIYGSEEFDSGKGSYREINVKQDYVKAVKEKIVLQEELNIAVNYGNGVTSVIAQEMLEELGCKVESVNKELDGRFPNHLPAPGEEKAQKALELHLQDKDLGIIFDGDGDRAGFMIPEVGYIEEDKVLALFAEEMLSESKGKVVHDLRASKLVKEIVDRNGGEPIQSRVGHTFISEMIHEDSEIVFAGELSGHYYFPGIGFPWDDGLMAAAYMCKIVSETDIGSKLQSYPEYPVSPELRIDCPHEMKPVVIEKVRDEYSDYEISTIDGLKIEFENGWALVRPSNTEEKMSVRCEADTEEDLEKILEKVESSVREAIGAGN